MKVSKFEGTWKTKLTGTVITDTYEEAYNKINVENDFSVDETDGEFCDDLKIKCIGEVE